MKYRALWCLPLVACQAVLGLEDTAVEAPHGDAGQGAVELGEAGSNGSARPEQPGLGGDTAQGGATGSAAAPAEGGALQPGGPELGGTGNEMPTDSAGAAALDDAWPKPSLERVFKVNHPWPHALLTACVEITTSDAAAGNVFWQHVQAIIEDNWLRAADLALVYAGACDGQHIAPFHFTIADLAGAETELGFPGSGLVRTITLGISNSDAEVLYAFGRALGFEHEYGRDAYAGRCVPCTNDRDCEQPGRPSCLASGYCGSSPDHESIMAAPDCGGVFADRRLTHWDVLGAQRAYGRKPAGSLLGGRNLCWNAESGLPASNLRITAWPCLRADNELWSRVSAGERDLLRATIAGQPFCAAAASAGASRPLLTQVCAPAEASQQFQFRSVKLLTLGGLCLAAKSAEAGSGLWTAECDSWAFDELAEWDLTGDHLRLSRSDLCITARDGAAVVGGLLQLETCDAGSSRQQLVLANAEIRFRDSSGNVACFNVANGTGVPGETVKLWNGCGFGFDNEHFMARGRLEADGRCADMLGEKPLIGTPIGMATCDGDTSQIWDYYW